MKTLALILILPALMCCTTTKTTATVNSSDGKTVTETTSQKIDTPSVLDILGGISKAVVTFVGL